MYGVTPPMKVDLPTDAELHATGLLIEQLKRENTFEAPAETEKRKQILKSLDEICVAFVKRVARAKEPKNEVLIRNAIGKIFTYGSFLLGVYGPGSDIDTLVVAPKYVTREDYFEHFPNLLVEMAPEGSITDMAVVTDAFVPIIKFEYSGISIDLIFSRIIQKQLDPNLTLKDNGVLRGLDDIELRSLNGNRVTNEILNLVPEPSTFRMALRAIKLWAQRRAIYANIMAFPGGVAWAMLVARVCQLYPRATPSVIVNKFFLLIGQWPWPQPVLLKQIESGPLPVRVWNPKTYKGDSFHLMPVITPAYPSMCSTFNITRSTMTIIQRELQRGLELSEKIMAGKRPWSDLFIKHTFFTAGYKYYICVVAASKTKEAHKVWSGYVESKVRMLVQRIETHASIALAHPFTKGFERRHICRSDEEVAMVQEGSLDFLASGPEDADAGQIKTEPAGDDAAHNVNGDSKTDIKVEPSIKVEEGTTSQTNGTSTSQQGLEPPIKGDLKTESHTNPATPKAMSIYTTHHYIGLELAEGAKSLDLSYQVDDFKALCTSWQKYKDDLVDLASIGVRHVKNFDLPDDVFEAGEVKPQKKARVKSAPNGKKREATEDHQRPTKRQQASVATAG